MSTQEVRLVPITDQAVRMGPEVTSADGPPQRAGYSAGELIFSQGDRADLVYVIDAGAVQILRQAPDGGGEHLATLAAGHCFGELGPLLGFPCSAGARASVTLTAFGPRESRQSPLDA